MIKRTLILTVLLLGSIKVLSQNQYLFNNYIANQGILNPAYNGSRDVISGLLIHRSQWIMFPNAPMVDALNVHGHIEETNVGLGLTVVNDHLGFTNTLDFMPAGTYTLQLDRGEKKLMFGLQMGLSSVVYDGTQAITETYGDPVFNGKTSRVFFNAGFGTYFYTDTYFLGLSIPKFFSNNFDDDYELRNKLNLKEMHTYVYGGYIIDWDPVKVRPAALIKFVYGAPIQIDAGASVLIVDRVWLGLTYRTISEAVFIAEYILNRQFTVRYSFDYSFSSIGKVAFAGSHELSLQFDFSFYKRPGMKTIRHW